MKKFMLGAGWLLAALLSPVALAIVPAHACRGCSDVELQQKAVSLGPGEHYLVDLDAEKLTYWQVQAGAATQVAVPAKVAAWWTHLMHLYEANGHSLVVNTTMIYSPADGVRRAPDEVAAAPAAQARIDGLSAWDVVDTGPNQLHLANAVAAWAHDPTGSTPDELRQAGLRVSLNRTETTTDGRHGVDIRFDADGSRIAMRWDARRQRMESVPGTARDGSGNLIPGTLVAAAGGVGQQAHYAWADTDRGRGDYARFKRRMAGWGVAMKGQQSPAPGADEKITRVTCTDASTAAEAPHVRCFVR